VLLGSLAAGVALGLTPLLLLIAGTACGLGYNLGLKDSRLSALPFVVALAVLPPFVWTALDVYRDEYLLLYAIGLPLALAAHLANALPDVEADSAAGRGGLVVTLGRGRTLALLIVCLVAPLIALVATFPGIEYETKVPGTKSYVLVWVVMGYVLLCIGVAALPWFAAGRDAAVWRFRLVALAGVLLAGGWLAAV
jgi:4-hydroxybenzoate polyprenyltransferase